MLPSIGTWYHLDNFIVTHGRSFIYQNWQKHATAIRQLADRQLIKPPGRYV
jgi:hypothetical protein